jgi:dTDP-4-dehydrorhamnose 3,5-epimerase
MKQPTIEDPTYAEDERGYFHHVIQSNVMEIAQINHSFSVKGVLRGMHFQKGQEKTIYCPIGEIFYVLVDINPTSETYMKWTSFILSGKNRKKLFAPEGYAHGFYTLSDTAHVVEVVSTKSNPKKEVEFNAFDKSVNIQWPETDVIRSFKDKKAPSLKEVI